jgi:hypothetical protein
VCHHIKKKQVKHFPKGPEKREREKESGERERERERERENAREIEER